MAFPSPVYVFIEDTCSQGLDSLFTDNPGTHNVISSNHVGVTTMEELDQSPLYPLHLETNMCLRRNRTRVACIAGEHSRKELFEQLVYLLLGTIICAGISTLSLSWGFSPRHYIFFLSALTVIEPILVLPALLFVNFLSGTETHVTEAKFFAFLYSTVYSSNFSLF